MPSSIRKALNELPVTLDDTYTRALECIPKEKWRHAYRLFQCLIAAIRPLSVHELGEIFAIQFNPKAGPKLVEDWRPLDPGDAVLSACSSLIAIVNVEGSKIVQFSHFSVKEFLTSDRLALSNVGTISMYHIPLGPAHVILAQACLTVLLQLDDKTDKKRLGTFPLAFYAAQHWVNHTKFGNVTPEIQDAIEHLFDPKKSHLSTWNWIHDVEWAYRRPIDELKEHPPLLDATALYFAAHCGFSWLARHLIISHAEDVNAKSRNDRTPLHAAYRGHRVSARELNNQGAEVIREMEDESQIARQDGHLEVMQLLLEHGANVDARDNHNEAVSHLASEHGEVEVVQLLLQHNANINARGRLKWTPLHNASSYKHIKTTQLLLEYGADINALDRDGDTPLILAPQLGFLEVVRLLLGHGADVHIQGRGGGTAFREATRRGYHETAQLLLEHGAEGEQEDRSEQDFD
jgi:ankyrin repeat protein